MRVIGIKNKKVNEITKRIPADVGIYYYFNNDRIVYLNFTLNLKESVQKHFKNRDNEDFSQIINKSNRIGFIQTDTLFEALLLKKFDEDRYNFNRNNRYKRWENYAYLAINFLKPPYLSLQEDTNKEFFYIGPFLDRFLIMDTIYSFADLIKTPACPSKKYPCERLNEKKCPGYCINDLKEKMFDLVEDNIIIPNPNLIKTKNDNYNKLMDNLDFNAADFLNKRLKKIKEYYNKLRFYYVTKSLSVNISHSNFQVKIENGLISQISYDDEKIKIKLPIINYRENETLAVNKRELEERWIIYEYLRSKDASLIRETFEKQKNIFKKKLEA